MAIPANVSPVLSGVQIPLAINASIIGSSATWPGGAGMFTAEATWGGGTVKLQVQSGNGTWIDVGADVTLTANGAAGFLLPKNAVIRCSIATSTAVYAYAIQM